MRLRLGRPALLVAATALLSVGCASKQAVVEEPPVETEPAPTLTVAPEVEVAAPEEQPPAEEPVQEPQVEQPPPEPEPQPEPPPQEKPETFQVTEEVYSKTFEELEALIREWNATIARKDYDTWHASLSRAYIAERGSADYLAELSRNQKLREKGLALTTLKDYFLYVVVPARVDAALDKISFVNENKVKAYANVGGDLAILFYVVREDGRWKIGTSGD
jgi:hypothetical protein